MTDLPRAADRHRPAQQRWEEGKALRKTTPRGALAAWRKTPERPDPVMALVDARRHDIARFQPIRYARMNASPAAFLRGAAVIMAADLGGLPNSGLWVQACGDCHLRNFGTFATPEGTPVFDLNDFDETLPAPFEWDLKRLATSFVVEAAVRGRPARDGIHLARNAILAYRLYMRALANTAPLEMWRARIDAMEAVEAIEDPKRRAREIQRLSRWADNADPGYGHLIEKRKGVFRIVARPPTLLPMTGQADDTYELAARSAFDTYRHSLPEEQRLLLDRYRLEDVAFKVVGIGGVGTFCAIGLFASPDGATLLLQIKEARMPVLAPYTKPSKYANQGRRVVVGQRIMQAQSDIFLGWTEHPGDDQHCYVRRLKDPRLARVAEDLAENALEHHATLCGMALARAHARSGDPAVIAGYMGGGDAFDKAIGSFAVAYAEQTKEDWALLRAAIASGQIEARED